MAILPKGTTPEKPTTTTPVGFVPPEKTKVAAPAETAAATPIPPEASTETTETKPVIPQEAEPAELAFWKEAVGEVVVAEVKKKPKYASMVSLKDAITPGLFGYGANKIVAASAQGQMKPDGVLIGETFDVQVLSFNHRWSVGPNDIPKGDNDAKFLFRDSYDKKTLIDQELGEVTIEEYAATIPELYKGHEVKEYFDVIVAAIGCANKKVEEDFLEKMLFVVQLPPSILGKFSFFAGAAGMKALSGRMDPKFQTCMRFRGVQGPNPSYTYSIFKFESCPADVLANYEPIDAAALVS